MVGDHTIIRRGRFGTKFHIQYDSDNRSDSFDLDNFNFFSSARFFSKRFFSATCAEFDLMVTLRILITIDVMPYIIGNWEVTDVIHSQFDLLLKESATKRGVDVQRDRNGSAS